MKMEEKIQVQSEENLPSIEYTLRPITYVSWLLGVGVAHPRKCPKSVTIIIRIIHLALCSISLIYYLIEFFDSGYNFKGEADVYTCLRFMRIVISHVSTFYYIYQIIGQYDKWPELMDKMKEVNEKIRREIPINDRPIKNMEVLAILATFTCCFLGLIVKVLHYYFTGLIKIGINLTVYYITAQSLINSFVFDVVVYVLYCRLQAINKLIGQLNELSDTSVVALKIRRTREMHSDICGLVNMVNDIHNFHLLLCSLTCLAMLVSELFRIYTLIEAGENIFNLKVIIISILYFTQFGVMCWICTLARREADNTVKIINKIALNFKHVNLELKERSSQSNLEMQTSVEDPNSGQNSIWSSSHYLNDVTIENQRKNLNRDSIRNEINDFLTQLQYCQVVFTAYDFFEINNGLFGAFIGVIVGYLTLCMQFYEPFQLMIGTACVNCNCNLMLQK
ncbi:uncharacterized protein LOC105829923 [Monomorium pharaonis]|uniref:uncharacterized protein LOC105829923 n=1 Tax=Monomorium pharaonis TaxID=307658 RepID=UPI00063ED879|nr:uncharacterized protein LOC105829923 [Monomorium pharaonis]